MKKEIEITCKGADSIFLEQLNPFQGNLKDLSRENYEKLKKEVLELGFSEPISVWKDKEKLRVLNGHQRLRVLAQLEKEGFSVPAIPINYVEAEDEKEAKKKILALTSQYGEMTGQGLYEFMDSAELSIDEVFKSFRFPEIDLKKFEKEYFEPFEPITGPQKQKKCPHCGKEI